MIGHAQVCNSRFQDVIGCPKTVYLRHLPSITTGSTQSAKAAVWLHRSHGCPWELTDADLCSDPYLFVHLSCISPPRIGVQGGDSGVQAKRLMATVLGLWFVAPEPNNASSRRDFSGAPWKDLIVPAEVHRMPKYNLPCRLGTTAWAIPS